MRRLHPLMTLILLASGAIGCGSDPAVRPAAGNEARGPSGGAGAAAGAPARRGEGSLEIDERIARACSMPEAYFKFDSASIEKDAQAALDAVATCFASGPLKGRRMAVVGHADPRGELEYNFALGHKRAGSVAEYITRRGVDSSKVATTSRGELEASGEDEAGWAKDRRVQILLGD